MRAPLSGAIDDAFAKHGVTHLCGVPIIMLMITGASDKRDFPQKIKTMTAAARPPTIVIKGMETLEISIAYLYGLTEGFGAVVMCAEKPGWSVIPLCEQTELKPDRALPMSLRKTYWCGTPRPANPYPGMARP